MMQEDAGLRFENVSKRYGNKLALSDVSLELEPGARLAVLGANGAGKTTLIRLACGLEPPTGGRILLDGVPVRAAGRLGRRVGYCPQEDVLYPELTAEENLHYAGGLFKVPRIVRAVRVPRLLRELGLASHAKVRAARLSGGMRRRLTLGCALVHDPALLVVEEPEAGLDPYARASMTQFLSHLEDTTVLLTSHDLEGVVQAADEVAVLQAGVLMGTTTPKRLVGGDPLARHLLEAPWEDPMPTTGDAWGAPAPWGSRA